MMMTLPNGLLVEAIEPIEAQTLYLEIFEMGTYSHHDIAIHEGQTVIDVGANMGLFSLLMLQSAPRLRLFAVEPVPLLHDLLQRNLQRYAGESKITILPVALADHNGEAEFIYTPHSTMSAGVASAQSENKAPIRDLLYAGLTDLAKIQPQRRPLYERLRRLLPVRFAGNAVALGLLGAYAIPATRNHLQTRRIRCPLMTLSQMIEQQQIERIDLLKIDVEGSETAVLAGIADADWPRIRQLVIEVQDIDGRVNHMRASLEGRGYQTFVEQEDWALHRLLHFYTIYATRKVEGKSARV